MPHAEMEGKETTLYMEVQELGKAVEQLCQELEINSPAIATDEKTVPYAAGAARQRVEDMVHELKASRCLIVESVRVIRQLLEIIGG